MQLINQFIESTNLISLRLDGLSAAAAPDAVPAAAAAPAPDASCSSYGKYTMVLTSPVDCGPCEGAIYTMATPLFVRLEETGRERQILHLTSLLRSTAYEFWECFGVVVNLVIYG